ncbi:hybrid sensor histidine kinase/response regulator [Zestomonas carbonaria]|uniref:histidine kinase n=1 Tax=Zestomonas carbonaria TaxID=2762745 RepID=A0A7U7ETH6_9GAMM|nr:hybrid sensor histidine kinase/response regulator [Pseudomonas carbonaria]CAD5110090.1 Sensor histidine kinase RcsC [Pseudomonas carbonaria]
MENDNSPIPKLAKISQRLNVGLLVVCFLTLLSVGISYWALSRLIQVEQDKIQLHFMRLIGGIQEHQKFLARIAHQSDADTQARDLSIVPLLQRRVVGQRGNIELHEGREFSFAMPFSVAAGARPLNIGERYGPFSLGVMLANFYSLYWSVSPFPSPQSLILDLDGDTSLAVPAIGSLPIQRDWTWDTYLGVAGRIRQRLEGLPLSRRDPHVRWLRAEAFDGEDLVLLGYVVVELPASLWWKGDEDHLIVATSLLRMACVDDYERLLEHPIFEELDLISPEGEVLLGTGALPRDYDEGLNFTGKGVLIKLGSEPVDGWVALYRISYQGFFHYAKWQLLGILALVLGGLCAGWGVTRLYARRVVMPAQEAHRHIVESDAFSRAIIQTAPVAVCVLRRDGDRRVVLHNALAREWLGTPEQIGMLARDWCLFKEDGASTGSACTVVAGRYLHVSFTSTRYQGEDVVLCAFNDITAHRDAVSALAEAKRSADAASEAKSVFLATMSHEIRTPLYGVLGTLELLGLTCLDSQQKGYLSTIQHSSALLLQLISDILDVSKIEAGEMALETGEFSPLEMVEEVLRSYAAMAAGKQLQLYGCIDPDVPRQVLGDAARIRQILNNLLSNALKFTDIGRVVLRLKVLGREGGRVGLQWQVTDTGIGIAKAQQEWLFEPFYQVDSRQHTVSGTGLGLSICQRLCQLMRGNLQVISEEGLGSSFTFDLELQELDPEAPGLANFDLRGEMVHLRAPSRELANSVGLWLKRWGAIVMDVERMPGSPGSRALLLDLLPESLSDFDWPGPRVIALRDATPQPRHVEGEWLVSLYSLNGIGQALELARSGHDQAPADVVESVRPERLGLRVLVTEDNPVNQELLKEQLEELGCTVVLAVDGKEALLRFDEEAFDILLTDLNMPRMSGYELTRALRGRGETLPIIGVTANALRAEGARCRAAGMDGWLVKPVSLQALHDCLLKVGGGVASSPVKPVVAVGEVMPLDSLRVPKHMHQLFVDTMLQDLEKARHALRGNDPEALWQQLHRMRGALAAVQARSLETACGELADILAGEVAWAILEPRVMTLFARIEADLQHL